MIPFYEERLVALAVRERVSPLWHEIKGSVFSFL
jgi:hypothetical protein